MEYLLQVLGGYSIGWGIAVICALLFLWKIYKKVEKYFSEKAIREKEKDEKIKKVIEQAEQYPAWHQQSINIREELNKAISELKLGIEAHQKKLEQMEEGEKKRERNKLRDRLLQSYRYYTSLERNPEQAWSKMEADAFWDLCNDYKESDGNGHVHTEVEPAMRKLDVIPMEERERISELMQSRR